MHGAILLGIESAPLSEDGDDVLFLMLNQQCQSTEGIISHIVINRYSLITLVVVWLIFV